jgi:serine/threonine protein kinase
VKNDSDNGPPPAAAANANHSKNGDNAPGSHIHHADAPANDEMHESWNDPVLFSLDENKICKDDFELMTVIGKGSFGKVMQVKKKDDGKIYAMKVLRKEAIIARKQVAHTKAEKSILQRIQHPFIVQLHYAFQTKDKLYMILDFINGGELFFHLKKEGRFHENRVRFYAAQITCAIAHLHSLGIVYRDLKPENILLDSLGNITITDFGLSKELKTNEGTHTFCGTPEYLAPEVLKGQGHGMAVDWWSLGTLIYEMLTGLPPFYSQNINIMYQKILNGELRFPSFIGGDAQSLLEGLLTRDVEKRLGSGADGSNDVKRHPFFKDIDWVKLERKELDPPFKPKVKDADNDISQIDECFKAEKPQDSLVEHSLSDTLLKENNFDGFTYSSDNVMDQAKVVS